MAIASGSDSFTVSIFDNDQPATTPSFPDGSINVDEGDGAAAVRVTLAAARPIVENVTVRCRTSGTAATPDVDFTSVDELPTFTPSDVSGNATNVTKTCSIPILDDDVDESQEVFSASLASPTGGATLPSPTSVNVSIIDGDGPPTASVATTSATMDEGIATYVFRVNLSAATGKTDIALGYRFRGTATHGYGASPIAGDDFIVEGGTVNYFGAPARTARA